jgi:hypothetical protein
MAGHVTQCGVFVEVGAARLPLPVARTPVGQWVAQVIADIDSGALLPCEHCGGYCGCGCDWWLEAMEAREVDPHGDLSWRESEELSY